MPISLENTVNTTWIISVSHLQVTKGIKRKWVRSLTSLYPAYVAASGSGVTILVRDRQERIDIEYVGRLDDAGGESEPGVTNTNVTASERTKRWQLEL